MRRRPPASGDAGTGDEATPLGTALDRVLRHLRAPTAKSISTVFSEWPAIAGAQLAAHAQPIALRDGELVIEVDDPVWASQLRWLEAELRERIAGLPNAPNIVRIRYRVRGESTR
jgi:predicted nucleic acid-binding Zn ribbon protein